MTSRLARSGTATSTLGPRGDRTRDGATGATQTGIGDDVVVDHLPVVGHVVAEIMTRVPGHVSRDDLTGAGVLALVQAARAYRPDTGVPFGQYARLRIRGAVVDHLRSIDWASRGARRQARVLAETADRLRAELGRPATTRDLAHAMGVTEADVERTRHDAHRGALLSLESGGGDGGEVLAASLATTADDPEARVAHAEHVGALLAAVEALPERLRTVIAGYDLHERPMAELAADLGVTESRVSQIRAEALSLLRDALSDRPVPAPRRPGYAHPPAGTASAGTAPAGTASAGTAPAGTASAGIARAGVTPAGRNSAPGGPDPVADGESGARPAPGGLAQRRRDAYVAAARGGSDLRARVVAGFQALEPDRAAPPNE